MALFEQGHGRIALDTSALRSRERHLWSTEVFQIIAVLGDVAIAVGSALAVGVAYLVVGKGETIGSLLAVSLSAALILVGGQALRGAYRVARLREIRRQIVWVLQGWAFAFFNLAWIAFLLKNTEDFSRVAITAWFVVGGLVLAAAHGFGARAMTRAFAQERLSHSRVAVIAVADEAEAAAIVDRLGRDGVEVASLTVLPSTATTASIALDGEREPEACALDAVRTVLAAGRLDGVWVFAPPAERACIDALRQGLTRIPVACHLFSGPTIERMLDRPLLHAGHYVGLEMQRAPLSRLDRALKRGLDLVCASTALVLLSPLMVLTAIAVVAESGRPVFFRQRRNGFGARPFEIVKFRSMTVRENGPDVVQATRGDARVTRVGRMIRRTSIDELPQLFNVLKGDMSLVGPRPHALAHDDYYDGVIATYAMRQHVKPGITGWAQVQGLRGETREIGQMRARVDADLWYIENWSLGLDVRILLKTAVKVLFDDTAF